MHTHRHGRQAVAGGCTPNRHGRRRRRRRRTSHEAHARRQRLLQRLYKLGALHVAAQLQLQRLDAAAVHQRLAEVVVALKEAAAAVHTQ